MKRELLDFARENNLSPFSSLKTTVRRDSDSIFKTTDAKLVFTKLLMKLSNNFAFSETPNFWNVFSFTSSFEEIKKRQDFFRGLKFGDNSFLKKMSQPRQEWSPEYDVVVVTEDERTFAELQKLNCPVQIIVNENDLSDLERYDVVQVLDCEVFSGILERLPQSVFIDDLPNVYLERYLEELSGWRKNLILLKENSKNEEILSIVNFLFPLFNLIDTKIRRSLTIEEAEKVLEEINDSINEKIRDLTLSGDSLVKILSEGKLPEDFVKIIENALDASKLPHEIFNFKIPVELDYTELEGYIQRQNANEFTNLAEEIKRNSGYLRKVPEKLDELRLLILFEDFSLGISKYLNGKDFYSVYSDNLHFEDVHNFFLEKSQPISFQLDNFSRCSILTGANSGGKTTLIENILQNIGFFQLGLPVRGRVHMPVFSDVYYFAKNKGSASRGAFETLLTQMSKIRPGRRTLILADEIEAVTEPGVAGKIIAATAGFYIRQNCFLVIATHLGYEIQDFLPSGARIDGIEAKGLDEEYNLIVDHNPVLGRLAHSTPELIVDRMANSYGDEYFLFLQESLRGKSDV